MKRGRSGGPPTRHQRDEYRARVDREAAAVILQDALDTRASRDRPLRPAVDTGDPRMTIRSGGRPRDRRQPDARRFESDAYATDYVPEAYEPSRRSGNGGNGGRRGGGRRGSGMGGVVKFLLFAAGAGRARAASSP